MIVFATRYLVELPRVRARFDLVGAITATLGVGALILGVISSSEVGWSDPRTLVALALGIVLLTVLLLNERRAPQPIMPLRLFASRRRSGAYAVRFLYLGAMTGFFSFTTQFLQGVFGWSALEAGLGFLPMTAVNFAVALAVPRLTARLGPLVLLASGVLLTLAGMAWLSRVDADSTFLLGVALPMVLIGAGQGLAFAPLTGYALADITGADAGAASGLLNTSHQLGSSLGLAILVAISSSAVGDGGARMSELARRVEVALIGSSALLACALLIVVAVILPAELARRRDA